MGLHNILFNIFVITFLVNFYQKSAKKSCPKKLNFLIAIFAKPLKYRVCEGFCIFEQIKLQKIRQKMQI